MFTVASRRLLNRYVLPMSKCLEQHIAFPMNDCGLHEVEAYLRGEEVDWRLIRRLNIMRENDDREYPTLTIRAEGREVITMCKATLEREFLFIRDYMSEFPDATEIELPYSYDQVHGALRPLIYNCMTIVSACRMRLSPRVLLSTCYECVEHLNPTQSYYRLMFDLDGLTRRRLEEIAGDLDKRTRSCIRDQYNVPNESSLLLCIASLWPYHQSISLETAKDLSSDYPSYFYYLRGLNMRMTGSDSFNMIKTGDYQDDCGIAPPDLELYNLISQHMPELCDTVEEMETMLAMLGIRSKLLNNLEVKKCLPYQYYDQRELMKTLLQPIHATIARVCELRNIHLDDVMLELCDNRTTKDATIAACMLRDTIKDSHPLPGTLERYHNILIHIMRCYDMRGVYKRFIDDYEKKAYSYCSIAFVANNLVKHSRYYYQVDLCTVLSSSEAYA